MDRGQFARAGRADVVADGHAGVVNRVRLRHARQLPPLGDMRGGGIDGQHRGYGLRHAFEDVALRDVENVVVERRFAGCEPAPGGGGGTEMSRGISEASCSRVDVRHQRQGRRMCRISRNGSPQLAHRVVVALHLRETDRSLVERVGRAAHLRQQVECALRVILIQGVHRRDEGNQVADPFRGGFPQFDLIC